MIPFLEGVQGHRDLLLGDGAHPTGEGYTIVVQEHSQSASACTERKEACPPITDISDGVKSSEQSRERVLLPPGEGGAKRRMRAISDECSHL